MWALISNTDSNSCHAFCLCLSATVSVMSPPKSVMAEDGLYGGLYTAQKFLSAQTVCSAIAQTSHKVALLPAVATVQSCHHAL